MNKRKLRRSRDKNKIITNHFEVTKTARRTCDNALNGRPSLEYQRGLIFFSTQTGEAWILDFEGNHSLRLADRYKKLDYKIFETKTNFQIEWREHFILDGDMFASIRDGKATVLMRFPTTELLEILDLAEKEQHEKR